ncbi:MAG: tetratricopeptide repeat protein, partial [Planctomycetota bacterium]|nr:tetratricopeptide repeat protein [Planctomycetota bacterium]
MIKSRFVLVVSALSALAAGSAARAIAADADAAAGYYCPPGAKFCPVPGTDNRIFLDTHFGLDAGTGEVRAYPGTVHPFEGANQPGGEETVLYSSPAPSVENRFVPNPDSPGVTPQDVRRGAVHQARFVSGRRSSQEPKSEVANDQTSRLRGERDPTEADKIPWWKGGMWRNRRDGKADSGKSSSRAPAKGSSSGSPQPPPLRADEDIWADDAYGGYGQADGYSSRDAAPGSQDYSPARQDYDPYAQPQAAYAPPPAAPQSSGYVSDPYTLPEGDPAYYGQPGYSQPASPPPYQAPAAAGYSQGYNQTYESPPPAPFGAAAMPPPPGYRSGSAAPAAGPASPRFENATRLVKESRFAEARTMLAEETSINPSSASAWRWLGDCQYNLLELDAAISSYERALALDPNDYYALRGHGFALLHRGHEHWRKMQDEVARGQKEQGAATFAQAHENYKRALEQLGFCIRRAPNDGESIYGEAMAAEGASRKLYSNAVSYLKLGPENRERAELFAENCLNVINKGVERARERSRLTPGESGPRALLGGLY